MKRIAALIFAAVLVLSMAGCSDSSQSSTGTNISTVSQKVESSNADPSSSDPEPSSTVEHIPVSFEMTDAQEMTELLKYTDFKFFAKAQDYDTETKVHTTYNGEIIDESTKKRVYEMLCELIKNSEVQLKDDQDVQSGRNAILTLNKDGKDDFYSKYTVSDGLLVRGDNDGGANVYVLKGPNSYHILQPEYQFQQEFEALLKKGVKRQENITEESGGDKISPAPTTKDDFCNYRITSYEFSAKAQKTDEQAERRYYYEGSAEDFNIRKELFEKLCRIVGQKEITLQGAQVVQGGGTPFITAKNSEGGEYTLAEGILADAPQLQGGKSILVLKTPDGKTYYLDNDKNEKQKLDELIQKGICTPKNLVKEEYFGTRTPDSSKKLTADDIAFIYVRTNYAEGTYIQGSYVSKKGEFYQFDFSEIEGSGRREFTDWLIEQIGIHSQTETAWSKKKADTDKLAEGLEYAAKIDPNANVTTENKMYDYGQNTLYAIVDGRFVMLRSRGDNDKTVEDENAAKAIDAYNEAMEIFDQNKK